MSDPDDETGTSEISTEEQLPASLRINLLRWDSQWLHQRLEKVQKDLDRALDEVGESGDS